MRSNHPVRSAEVAARYFLWSRPPLKRRGMRSDSNLFTAPLSAFFMKSTKYGSLYGSSCPASAKKCSPKEKTNGGKRAEAKAPTEAGRKVSQEHRMFSRWQVDAAK